MNKKIKMLIDCFFVLLPIHVVLVYFPLGVIFFGGVTSELPEYKERIELVTYLFVTLVFTVSVLFEFAERSNNRQEYGDRYL